MTGGPSSKTSYVVLGDDAGPSKLTKIREHKIKTINEEGLFELIRRLPAGGGSGKGAEKVRQKRKEEEEKIKKQAAEMEQEEKRKRAEEEKARKAAVLEELPLLHSQSSPLLPSYGPSSMRPPRPAIYVEIRRR